MVFGLGTILLQRIGDVTPPVASTPVGVTLASPDDVILPTDPDTAIPVTLADMFTAEVAEPTEPIPATPVREAKPTILASAVPT